MVEIDAVFKSVNHLTEIKGSQIRAAQSIEDNSANERCYAVLPGLRVLMAYSRLSHDVHVVGPCKKS